MRALRILTRARYSTATPKKTALYDLHNSLGGKIVEFGGYALPVQYQESLINSHLHCRKNASLFDVSHMGQLRIKGDGHQEFFETLTPADIKALGEYRSKLSVFTTDKGGVIDDLMITKKPDHLFVVVNAGCKDKDMAHIREQLKAWNKKNNKNVTMEYLDNRSLLALQGPKASEVLTRYITEWKAGCTPASGPGALSSNPSPQERVAKLPFMSTSEAKIGKVDVFVTRCGYTGEDGYEISIPNEHAVTIAKKLLETSDVQPAGLGPRDSLRLEAGLCLYGHELTEEISPIEAGLAWLIDKRRRTEGGFLGSDHVLKQLKDGTQKKRVGLEILKGAPARENAELLSSNGEKIGWVTSGTFSPSLKKAIAIGYVQSQYSKPDTEIQVKVREKISPVKVVKMPFVPTHYYKPS